MNREDGVAAGMNEPSGRTDADPIRALAAAVGLTLAGVLGAEVATIPALVADPGLAGDRPDQVAIEIRTAFLVLNFLGMAAVGALYLHLTGRGRDFLDLYWPNKRDWGYALGATAAVLGIYVVATVLITILDLPAADNQIVAFIGDDTTMVLVMIVVVFLFNAPAEEFLFRNVIQKRLYEAFTRMGAVVVTSVIFALVHFPVFYVLADSVAAAATPVTILFTGSIVFGYAYVRTENLVVPTFAHAVYNAAIFGLLYVSMVTDLEGPETVGGLVSVATVGLG